MPDDGKDSTCQTVNALDRMADRLFKTKSKRFEASSSVARRYHRNSESVTSPTRRG